MPTAVEGTHPLRPTNPAGGCALQTRGHRPSQRPHLRTLPPETTQMSVNSGKDTGIVVQASNGVLQAENKPQSHGGAPRPAPT